MSDHFVQESFYETYTLPRKTGFLRNFIVGLVFSVSILGGGIYFYGTRSLLPPPEFPLATDITISEGLTVTDIAKELHAQGVIRSPFVLYLYAAYTETDTRMQAGTYRFDEPLPIPALMSALTSGTFQEPLIRVTFPEGFTAKNITEYLPESFTPVEHGSALIYEGYLFPDTYFIRKDTSYEELIALLQATYEEKVGSLREQMASAHLTEKEVITLASIIEREANSEASMKMVAGILFNRLAINMPLQVDAVFEYLIGKTSAELTEDDLMMDSPFNTYLYKGIPPTPIANPGLIAIHAVLDPTPSDYLYYLTDTEGKFHYAKTFDEHKQNKARYLR